MRQMGLRPLEQWRCDVCHHVIRQPDDGWIEWKYTQQPSLGAGHYSDEKIIDMRIVHRWAASPRIPIKDPRLRGQDQGCCYSSEERGGDTDLTDFVGPDGLSCLIGMLTKGEIADIENWADIVRRLHIPNYEEARMYLDKVEEDGLFDEIDPEDYYNQDRLKRIIQHYGPPPASSAKHR